MILIDVPALVASCAANAAPGPVCWRWCNAIAACAIAAGASLWTLNRGDFADIPGLRLVG